MALTTDDGGRWAKSWADWANYEKFFNQVVRVVDAAGRRGGQFHRGQRNQSEGQVRVVVTALDQEHEFLNFLDLGGTVVGPKLDARSLQLRQTAPGRYVGNFEAKDTGSYFLVLNPGGGRTVAAHGGERSLFARVRDRGTNTTPTRAAGGVADSVGPGRDRGS